MRKSMWRPEIAGWSTTRSQSGWRPTTVTAFASSSSAVTLSSKLRTMRAAMASSGLPEDAAGAKPGRAHEVADAAHAFHAERDLVRGLDLVLGVEQPRQRDHAVAALHRELAARGARVAAQGGADAPLEAKRFGAPDGFGCFLEARL